MADGDGEMRSQPTKEEIRRQVSKVLRGAADPNALTFKQVRIDVEQSLGLPEGSLQKENKSTIKTAVHDVMDELDAEAEAESSDSHDEPPEQAAPQQAVKGMGTRPVKAEAIEGDDAKRAISKKRKAAASDAGANRKGNQPDGNASSTTAAKGKKRKGGGGAGDDDNFVCVLNKAKSTRKQVTVKTWKGNVQVDIREYYEDRATGEFKPGKKGITLNPAQWRELREAQEAVDSMIAAES